MHRMEKPCTADQQVSSESTRASDSRKPTSTSSSSNRPSSRRGSETESDPSAKRNRPGSDTAYSTYARPVTRGHLVETSLHGAQELLHDPLGDCGDEVVEIGKMPVGGIVRDADSPREASNPQTTGPLFMHRGDRRIEESLP